jgi:hypothetical protein
MKKFLIPCLIFSVSLCTLPAFAQNQQDSIKTLGLPGDNLDLYAVLTLFQKSKTIEAFEKDLNLQETGINNLDLDLDKKVDFIKVVTTQQDSSFTFTLQVDVTKTETQDVASILVDKDKNGKVLLQIVGAEALYGKDYVIEPKGQSVVTTANPAYTGSDPVATSAIAQSVVTVQSAPIVQYVYSPVYVPYVPPYYYGYYPPYHFAFTVMAIGIYHNNCYHYHGGYYGGHYGGGNTIIINNGNRNYINHNNSNTVNNNMKKGGYGNRQGTGASAANRPTTSNNKAGTGTRQSGGVATASTRPSTGGGSSWQSAATKQSGVSSAARPSTSNYSSAGRSSSMGASRSMSSGGRSMSSGAGMSRGGGGGRRR